MSSPKAESVKIVISHAAVEKNLAQELKDLFCDAIPHLRKADVWFSSDRSGAFDPRFPYYNQIVDNFDECTIVVTIQSPVSKNRPWPLWESGYACGLGKGPVVFTFAASGHISGRLESPLDVQQQYDGTDRERIIQALKEIAKALDTEVEPADLPQRIEDFLEKTRGDVQKCKNASLTFDRRLILVLTAEQYKEIQQTETIPTKAIVLGDDLTLDIFSFRPQTDQKLFWGDFVAHLDTIETPWPSSAARWAKNLAEVLKQAKGDRLISESEALPLYFSKRLMKSLRPALSSRVDKGDFIEFEITFIDIPEELTVRPAGDVGILFHYLDFCRMMRWGVLDSPSILALKTRTNSGRNEVKDQIRSLLTKIANIRTEFWNRGLQKDSLIQVMDPAESNRIIEMLKTYYAIIEPLDPNENGDGPANVPSKDEFLARIDKLSESNKQFFKLVSNALNECVQKL